MSSIDVHNQFSYQQMVPEAVALVLNPQSSRYGKYTLTPHGMGVVKNCPLRGPHPHSDLKQLYTVATQLTFTDQKGILLINSSKLKSHSITGGETIWQCENYGAPPTNHANSGNLHVPAPPVLLTLNQQPETTAFSVSSRNRPELGNNVEFDHDYSNKFETTASLKELKKKTGQMIDKCTNYIHLEAVCSLSVAASAQHNDGKSWRTRLVNLENSIIDTVTCDLSTATCYVATFLVNDSILYTRWMDSGDLEGFISTHKNLLDAVAPSIEKQVLWNVMTPEDLSKRTESYQKNLTQKRETPTSSKRTHPTSGRRWDQLVTGGRLNKKSVQLSHRDFTNHSSGENAQSVVLFGTIVHIAKKHHRLHLDQSDLTSSGFYVQTGIYESLNTDMVKAEDHYKIVRVLPSTGSIKSFINVVQENHCSTIDLKNQELFINMLPNDAAPEGRDSVSHSMYFSTGSAIEEVGGEIVSKYIPTSVRNRVLYFWRLGKTCEMLSALNLSPSVGQKRKSSVQGAARTKKRMDSDSYMNVTDSFHADPCVTSNSSPFMLFVQGLVRAEGILKWRLHAPDVDILVMNDISLDTGTFLNNSFVHIYIYRSSEILHFCTCKMFNTISRMDHAPPDATKTCCHVRFFKEFIEPHYSSLFPSEASNTLQKSQTVVMNKILHSMDSMNNAVVRLDTNRKFHRFSVLSKDVHSCAIVKLQSKRLSCTSGKCRATKGHRRKVTNLGDASNCEHLQVLTANQEQWNTLVDISETSVDDDDDDDVDGNDEQHATTAPFPLLSERPDNPPQHFNPETGLWSFESLSTHTPRELKDPVLRCAIQQRLAICAQNPDVGTSEEGYFLKKTATGLEPFKLFPNLDKDTLCLCGVRYWNEAFPEGVLKKKYPQETKMYLQNGVARFEVYDRDCLQGKDGCRSLYSGHQDGVHFLSKITVAGDEIGWDFVNHVTNCQMSITAFCTILESRYYASDVHFMSRQTFTDWVFSWLSNFKIDFRKPCGSCKFNPKILACDGTKLGIFFKNVTAEPFETPTSNEIFKPRHKRTDRKFFNYSQNETATYKESKRLAQKDLLYFVAKNSNSLKEFLGQPPEKKKGTACNRDEKQRQDHLLKNTPEQCNRIMSKFIGLTYHPDIIKTLCPIFKVLASDCPVTSLLNYRFLDCLQAVINGAISSETVTCLRNQMPEVHALVEMATRHDQMHDVTTFIDYLVSNIVSLHENDKEPDPASVVLDVYNPEKLGCAYYFTEHGGRLRDLPRYDVSENKEPAPECRKAFQEATKSGTTYLFLWFDPLHGHCYGFHLITSSEGRKDPFSSAYMYMKEPPSEIFYDFSCQLEEYSLNREPKFFRNCRFYHDIFHGFTHKCPYVYMSQRIPGLNLGINTEICEQFNSFIQKIKYSGRSMSQSHFIFYLQFFVHRWNVQKEAVCDAEEAMARLLLT